MRSTCSTRAASSSATERMAYILRVRTIAKACCASYLEHVAGVEPAADEKKEA